MRAFRVLLVSCVLLAALPVPTGHAAPQRVGPDLTTASAPAANCGGQTCSAVQLEGPGATEVPTSGTITRFRLRHGAVPGGLLTTEVHLAVYSRSGDSFTVVRESGPLTVPATDATDRTDVFAVSVPVVAGQYLGVRVLSAWAGSDAELKVIGAGASSDTVGRYIGNHASGTAAYGRIPGSVVLFNADLETGGTGDGDSGGDSGGGTGDGGSGGDSGGGTDGGGSGGTGGSGGGTTATCPTSAGSVTRPTVRSQSSPGSAGKLRVAKGGGSWRGGAVLRNDKFFEVKLAYDANGRRHVVGRGGAYQDVYYAGPSGKRRVAQSAWGGGSGLAIDGRNRPVVGYGDSEPQTVNGRIVFCPRFRTVTGTSRPTDLRALPDGAKAFSYTELGSDPKGGRVHTAYDVGEQLYYQPVGGKPVKMPFTRPRVVRVAVGGGVVAVAASNDSNTLVLFTRKGVTGAFTKRTIAKGVGHYDLAVARDGTPKIAFTKRGRLHVYNGKGIVGSNIPAFRVGVAADAAKNIHVAFSPSDSPDCYGNVVGVWCTGRNGVFHLRLNAQGTAGRWTTVQGSIGYSPARFSVATYRNRAAIAYGDPGANGYLKVRTKSF